MERYICDGCGAQGEPQSNNNVPHGWYSVYRPFSPAGKYLGTQRHVCSPDCLNLVAHNDLADAAITPAEPAHV